MNVIDRIITAGGLVRRAGANVLEAISVSSGTAADAHKLVMTNEDGQLDSSLGGGGGGGGITGIPLSLFSGNESTIYGSATKLILGGQHFNPADPQYGLKPTSTATLFVLLETSSGAAPAAAELFQQSGTSSPQIIAATTTTTSLTAALVTADVSAAFKDTSPAGIFVVRIWITAPNGFNLATCTGAWLHIVP